jgi:dTDP-4-dehydrorhamnose 3,5-epimerase-like enzyme
MATIDDCRLIDLPRIPDERGSLTFVESRRHAPFAIERVYWIYDVPGGAVRGGHAYRTLHELVIAISGSFDVEVEDGSARRSFTLNRSYRGLHVPPMIWRQLTNFSTNSVCLICASQHYDEGDYFRDYDDFAARK